ncbi:MAG: cobalamin biosynthesis protein CobW [Telmatospirillum sp.]|nr:cobalamin biosynthesis protein CobW [Telmatospirillum sp.]
MTRFAKIPATVVTGFLGAGKTTLIRHLLAHAGGRRIALVINEFGDVGVDGGLLAGCGDAACGEDDIIELANGCLCCTVADEFIPAMERLLDRESPPDHIVIETSGLALPKPLVKAFDWPDIRARVTVDGVIAVVDGPSFATGRFTSTEEQRRRPDHDNPLEEVFVDQLASADLVLLNKADLLSPAEIDQLSRRLEDQLRPGVKLVPTRLGEIAPGVLLGLGAAAEDDLAARPSLHDTLGAHDHDDFESFAVPMPDIADPQAFTRTIGEVIARHDILRLKGFLSVTGKDMRHVIQAVGARVAGYYDRPWRTGEDRQGELVVIGCKGLDRTAIADALSGGSSAAAG